MVIGLEYFIYYSRKIKIMKYILILCVGLLSFIGYSQSVEGMWNTYDDDSGELLSEVKVHITKIVLKAIIVACLKDFYFNE